MVIIKMCALWLAEDCDISCYNQLAPSDYSEGAKFQNGHLMFCQKSDLHEDGNVGWQWLAQQKYE